MGDSWGLMALLGTGDILESSCSCHCISGTIRARGVPHWVWARMRRIPLGPYVERSIGGAVCVRGERNWWAYVRMRTRPLGAWGAGHEPRQSCTELAAVPHANAPA